MEVKLKYPVVKYLEDARDLLAQPGGYIKGYFENNRGGYCALGALSKAASNLKDRIPYYITDTCSPAILSLEAHIPAETKKAMATPGYRDHYHRTAVQTSSSRVVAHNNADSSTQESVVAWFDRAIATEREHPTEKA